MSGRREPRRTKGRQTSVNAISHDDHDLTTVAALAAGDLGGDKLEAARALIGSCDACAELHVELQGIATATRALPAPERPRDFRITPEQAASLRPTGWRRFVAAFGSPRFAVARPVGVGLATVGLAGLLLTAVVPGQAPILSAIGSAVGDQAGAGAERDTQGDFGTAPELAPQPEATGEPLAPAAGEGPSEVPDAAATPGEAAAPTAEVTIDDASPAPGDGATNGADATGSGDEPIIPWLPAASIALVGGGVALVLLRRAGERT